MTHASMGPMLMQPILSTHGVDLRNVQSMAQSADAFSSGFLDSVLTLAGIAKRNKYALASKPAKAQAGTEKTDAVKSSPPVVAAPRNRDILQRICPYWGQGMAQPIGAESLPSDMQHSNQYKTALSQGHKL